LPYRELQSLAVEAAGGALSGVLGESVLGDDWVSGLGFCRQQGEETGMFWAAAARSHFWLDRGAQNSSQRFDPHTPAPPFLKAALNGTYLAKIRQFSPKKKKRKIV
jgi:hypothetical protein